MEQIAPVVGGYFGPSDALSNMRVKVTIEGE
jgi:hypothetical protein